ncbi:RIO1 family regulatory kinase/ATPase [Oceanimonas smirnovii]|uniref:RIO1 family regulatory kinase/ATPase domain-containing protein n=1 Tax=Oceanimonas smirnovii TaxID=264574 RepID=UPI0012E9EDA1|nr:RIO1 family regulatory kinase/ATPase [Oceanimonas smirnovii]
MSNISYCKIFDEFRYLMFSSLNYSALNFISNSKTENFELLGSSTFFISENEKVIGKVKPDKYNIKTNLLKWFFHDFVEKRIFFQTDAIKEYRSLNIIKKAGLKTPECYGFGVSFNPLNKNGSLLLVEFLKNIRVGGEVFDELNETSRLKFLDKFSEEVAILIKLGYVHRDLHYNNILVDCDNNIIWIDAHVKKLPSNNKKRASAILKSFDVEKLRGEKYRSYVELNVLKNII